MGKVSVHVRFSLGLVYPCFYCWLEKCNGHRSPWKHKQIPTSFRVLIQTKQRKCERLSLKSLLITAFKKKKKMLIH